MPTHYQLEEFEATGTKEEIRIVHISDLHIGVESQRKRDALFQDMRVFKPHTIAVTGDIVNNPWFSKRYGLKFFDRATDLLTTLRDETLGKRVLLCPGNHDTLLRSVRHYSSKLNAPEYYCTFFRFRQNQRSMGVTFFSFNSTCFWGREWGRVSKQQIQHCRASIQELEKDFPNDYRNSYKIAMLHHHPLPTRRSEKEEFLFLKNSGEFLDFIDKAGINMILHGHKHDPLEYH